MWSLLHTAGLLTSSSMWDVSGRTDRTMKHSSHLIGRESLTSLFRNTDWVPEAVIGSRATFLTIPCEPHPDTLLISEVCRLLDPQFMVQQARPYHY